MNLNDLEKTFEPIFCMYKMQREEEHEAFGTFCHRVGNPAIEEYIKDYVPGSHASMPDPFNVPEVVADASVGITADLLATLQSAAGTRGLSAETLLDTLVREALEDDAPEDDAPEESA
jgi:sulfite reductase (ferredoxin)